MHLFQKNDDTDYVVEINGSEIYLNSKILKSISRPTINDEDAKEEVEENPEEEQSNDERNRTNEEQANEDKEKEGEGEGEEEDKDTQVDIEEKEILTDDKDETISQKVLQGYETVDVTRFFELIYPSSGAKLEGKQLFNFEKKKHKAA